MFRKIFVPAWGLLAVVGLALSGCQPQLLEIPVTVVVKETQVQTVVATQVVKETQVVEVEKGAFTTPHPILSDRRIRQSLAYCTNRADLLRAVYPLLTDAERESLFMHTFIPRSHWAYAGDANITVYAFDPEKGKALLDEAGWTLADGATFRANADGDELALKFTTTTAAFRQTWAPVWEQQMADCGIRIVRLHVPASWFFGDTTGTSRRDCELCAYGWVGQPDPGGNTLYGCDQIPLPENGWVGQNIMGWCNEAASNGIKQANNTLIKVERVEAYKTVQQEFTHDMVSLPLFNRTNTYAINAGLQGFAPSPAQQFVTYNIEQWEIPGKDTIVYGFTQEPASLFTLVENAQVAVLANSLIQGFGWTSLNYEFQPALLTELAALESGLTTNNDVEVKEGDKVWDASGSVAELKPGVMVRNAQGEVIEFTSGAVTMKQLVSTFRFPENLTWSDGTPVSQADYELKFKIDCDRESGATSFITCDQTQKVEFAPNGYTITLLPGVQSPLYFVNFDANGLTDIYPAHRVLSDGRRLADVPAAEWTTLLEIAENPIGVGPYILKEWVKGEKIVFEANPSYYKGAPRTKNLVIAFITPENAEAQLIGGQVDILDFTTLVGVSETLKNAADEGTIKVIVDPSASWEHIDMNLFLP